MATESTYTRVPGRRPAGSRAAAAVRDLETDRVIGIVGALTVVVATGLSWYSEKVTIAAGGVVEHSITGFTLWHVRNLAAWLLVGTAVVGILSLTLGRDWRAGLVAAVAGFGISLYSLVAVFTLPDLGSSALVGRLLATTVSTAVDVGPFVALLGGLLLLVGGAAASRDG
jgi:hypothetical protein